MKHRRATFVIPALTVALSAPGCAEPILGDWEADTFPFQGAEGGPATVDMPYQTTLEYNLRTCQYSYDINFDVDEQYLDGDLHRKTESRCTAATGATLDPIVQNTRFDVTVEVVDKRSRYEITLEGFLNDEDVVLDCTLNKAQDGLDCEDEGGLESSFNKREE